MVEYDLISGGWTQWPQLPEGRYHFTVAIKCPLSKLFWFNMLSEHMYEYTLCVLTLKWTSPLAKLCLRYGHKCGRVADKVVIIGGADQRGDYVPSTMLLDLVTRQVSTKKAHKPQSYASS